MAFEAAATKAVKDSAQTGIRAIDTSIKKAWSILDAAQEKRGPSQVLSESAIQAIQGKANPQA